MSRFRNFLLLVAVLAGAVLLGSPSLARADYGVRVYDDGVLQFEAVNGVVLTGTGSSSIFLGNSLTYSATTTHFLISNGSGLSNNPGTQEGSSLDLSSNQIIKTTFGSTGGMHTIRIELSQTDWLAPTGNPLTLSSLLGAPSVTCRAPPSGRA